MTQPAPIPLSEILMAALGPQLEKQTRAARLDVDAMTLAEFDQFYSALRAAAFRRFQPLGIYCLTFPGRAAAAIHEAAATIVKEALRAHILKTAAQ